MNKAEVTLAVFTACNLLRVMAYLPQLIRINRDTQGAFAISYSSWFIFGISNLSTVAYALTVTSDWAMALLFGANTLCCFGIIALTALKRSQYRANVPARARIVQADTGEERGSASGWS